MSNDVCHPGSKVKFPTTGDLVNVYAFVPK